MNEPRREGRLSKTSAPEAETDASALSTDLSLCRRRYHQRMRRALVQPCFFRVSVANCLTEPLAARLSAIRGWEACMAAEHARYVVKNDTARLCCAMVILMCCAASGAATATFPSPERPVAPIVSAKWGDPAARDAADEIGQIATRLRLRAGMTVADIGAGAGYDSFRLAGIVGPGGAVIAEDVTPAYVQALHATARSRRFANIRTLLGAPSDPGLSPASIDAAIMVHMYHEIERPYALLYNLVPAFRPGGLLGVEELDRPTQFHGTPPALLTCEFAAVGYRRLGLTRLTGGLGYFAVFAPPAPDARPRPEQIIPCRG
jgi:SAM-dependent methyltransferase